MEMTPGVFCAHARLVSAVSVELEAPPEHDLERGFDRVTSVAVLIGVVATIIAGATIWLVLTDPVTVANALDEGEISPLVRQLAEVIYNAISGLLEYL
jgi:hypothetical protein